MVWVRNLNNNSINHRHVRGDGHAVIQKSFVLKFPIFIINVFFIQSPPNTLDSASLHLAFNIVRRNSAAGILKNSMARWCREPRLRVDYNINQLCTEGSTLTRGINF